MKSKSFEFLISDINDLQKIKETYEICENEIKEITIFPCIVYVYSEKILYELTDPIIDGRSSREQYHLKKVNEEVISKYISALDDTWK